MGNILDRFQETFTEIRRGTDGKKFRVGIIGCGWIAEAHIMEYQKMPDV